MGNFLTLATVTSAATTAPTPSVPPFDLNVAVIMAGFAFDAYKTPDRSLGYSQMDGTGCETLYVSKDFLYEWYSGQLTVNVVKAVNLPDVDYLGTSDPYVVVEVSDGYGKTNVIEGNTKPVWNKSFDFLILPSKAILKVKVKDSNILSSDKKLGETTMPLKDFCDGQSHTIELDLKGKHGGGKLTVEVQFRTFEQIGKVMKSAMSISDEEKLKTLKLFHLIMGSPDVSMTDFVTSSASGVQIPEKTKPGTTSAVIQEKVAVQNNALVAAGWKPPTDSSVPVSGSTSTASSTLAADLQALTESVKSGEEAAKLTILENLTAESGTATTTETTPLPSVPAPLTAATVSLFNQTDSLVASYAVVKATEDATGVAPTTEEEEQMLKDIFATAESTAEAWALLADSLNQTSVVASKFVKICFVQNKASDTQAIIWRDLTNKRLVVAFRGTEKRRPLDVITDIRVLPTYDDNAWVHSGFVDSLNSIKDRLIYGIQYVLESPSSQLGEGRWQVWFTGHSLGAALATIFAKEWAESPLGKSGKYDIKKYNFGSPRVGFEGFVDQYSALVKDSWRVVNLQDIVPTVPRLTGYRHVQKARIVEAMPVSKGKTPEEEQEEDSKLSDYLYGDTFVLHNLLATQLAIAATLKDLKGVSMHMENYYYLALLQEVKAQLASQSKAKIAATA